jgi:uncharacterized membrane protein
VATYSFIFLMAGAAYYVLSLSLIRLHGRQSTLAIVVGRSRKGIVSLSVYLVAIAIAFVRPWVSLVLCLLVALLWFIPERRIEAIMNR